MYMKSTQPIENDVCIISNSIGYTRINKIVFINWKIVTLSSFEQKTDSSK